MRNTLTKLDIINSALSITGTGLLKNFDGADEITNKAQLFYNRHYQALLALFPWHFVTRREQMTRTDVAGSKYKYRYIVPGNVLYVWDIYPDREDYIDYGDSYDSSRVFTPYSYPLQRGAGVVDDIGEIIQGDIHSDSPTLFIFYTFSQKVPEDKFTQQFVTLLVNKMEMDLSKAKLADTEKLALLAEMHENDKNANLKDQSIENKTSVRIPRARIMGRLDRFYGW